KMRRLQQLAKINLAILPMAYITADVDSPSTGGGNMFRCCGPMKEESLAHLDNRLGSRCRFAGPGSSGDLVANGLHGGTGTSSHAAKASRGHVWPGSERLATSGRWQPVRS